MLARNFILSEIRKALLEADVPTQTTQPNSATPTSNEIQIQQKISRIKKAIELHNKITSLSPSNNPNDRLYYEIAKSYLYTILYFMYKEKKDLNSFDKEFIEKGIYFINNPSYALAFGEQFFNYCSEILDKKYQMEITDFLSKPEPSLDPSNFSSENPGVAKPKYINVPSFSIQEYNKDLKAAEEELSKLPKAPAEPEEKKSTKPTTKIKIPITGKGIKQENCPVCRVVQNEIKNNKKELENYIRSIAENEGSMEELINTLLGGEGKRGRLVDGYLGPTTLTFMIFASRGALNATDYPIENSKQAKESLQKICREFGKNPESSALASALNSILETIRSPQKFVSALRSMGKIPEEAVAISDADAESIVAESKNIRSLIIKEIYEMMKQG